MNGTEEGAAMQLKMGRPAIEPVRSLSLSLPPSFYKDSSL
jgi:hypothetical protein